MNGELIVNLTPTGMIPTKEMTPHVPLTPDEIVRDVLRCADVGVTMVHLHARDEGGNSAWQPEIYARIIGGIREKRPDLILAVTCSGRTFSDFERRSAVLKLKDDLKPDMASLTLSSLNFNQIASVNPPDLIKDLAQCMKDHGIKPELEAFDLGMLNYARYLERKGLISPPFYFNLILGNIACAQADLLSAGLMITQLPSDSVWSLGGIGNWQLKMNLLAIIEGGGVRVGLEDNIYWDRSRTRLAENVDLIERIVRLAGSVGRRVMAPKDCRVLLQL